MKNIIRLATRNSPLALKQANMVKQLMSKSCEIKIVPMTSSGDTVSQKVFKQHGGKELVYIPCLNSNEDQINMIQSMVNENIGGW